MPPILSDQYQLIRDTRQTLFSFLETIAAADLHRPVAGFGSGSIIETHIHVADCYLFWLGKFALQQSEFTFATDEACERANVADVRARFDRVDTVVDMFMNTFDGRWDDTVQNYVRWQAEPLTVTPLWLLTHTETHEFHHKGQIVSMARQLGYVPPDTDLTVGK